MMAVVTVAGSEVEQKVDAPSAVRERLEAFGADVLAEAMNRPVQVRNGGLYLRGEWCDDSERRLKAKIPEEVVFKTKPELALELTERAAGWEVAKAPILGDCAYGKNTELRERLDDAELEYVLSVSEEVSVFSPETTFEVPSPRTAGSGRQKTRPRPARGPEQTGEPTGG